MQLLPSGLLLASLARASSLSPVSARSLNANTLFAEETSALTDISLEKLVRQLHGQSTGLNYTSLLSVFGFSNSTSLANQSSSVGCKTYAGDSSWPDDNLWYAFDSLLNNALLEVPPIASPCYTNWLNYDEDVCATLSDKFTDSYIHMEHPTSIMSPFYQGATCMPIDGAPANCTWEASPTTS